LSPSEKRRERQTDSLVDPPTDRTHHRCHLRVLGSCGGQLLAIEAEEAKGGQAARAEQEANATNARQTATPVTAPVALEAAAHSPVSLSSQEAEKGEMSKPQSSQGKSSPGGSNGGQRGRSSGRQQQSSSRPRKLGQLKLEDAKIGIIGAGKIADALVQGFINYGKIQANRIHVAAPSSKNLENFKNYGCHVTKRNIDIFGRYDCDIIFVCVHGAVVRKCFKTGGLRPAALCTNYVPYMRHPLYVVSLVSGTTVDQLKQTLINPDHPDKYVIEQHRVMVNTAAMYGLGLCAIDCEPDSKKLSPVLRQLLSSVGKLEYVPESQMDAACAIGGSGLAFSYFFISALSDGAFKMGLSRQMALRFAAKTLQCAAQTQLESGKHPGELKDDVCAPSGAAVYGVHVLNKADVASGIAAAIEAAHKRASELAEPGHS